MILLPKQPKIIEKGENWAKFEIESLYPGYGTTIGNSLRRVLISSLPGAAITQVKIKGVQHEFSTIPGVLEDVITIAMNLRQLRFKIFTDEPQKATLKIKGEKKIKGSDFECPSQIELINKDQHIATLTDKKSDFEIEIQVEKGIGYEPAEERKSQKKIEIGVISIDAIYTPIERVSFKVENMRVGERTDFDRLYLEIRTDGTISPEDALVQSSNILVEHFSLFSSLLKEEKPKKEKSKEKEENDNLKKEMTDFSISSRTINILNQNSIKTIGGLIKKSESQILELEGMGEKGIKEIKKALKKIGLELKS